MDIKLGNYSITKPDAQKKALAMLLWGPAGCGKTTLAATAPGKKLWINFDPRGPASLVGRDDCLILDLADEKPGVVERFKSDDPLSVGKFVTEQNIDTIVFDSCTNFSHLALMYAVTSGQLKGATIERPSLQGYGYRNAYTLQAVKNLLRMSGKLNKHIIFIAHEASPETTEEGVVLYITIMLGGQLSEQVPLDLSEVWAMYDTGGKRTIAIRPCRNRKPMKTRMFLTNSEPEFAWKYDADKRTGEGISDWYERWVKASEKIPLPK